MLSADEKIIILGSGKLAIVNSVLAGMVKENKGQDSSAEFTNAWNALSVHDTIIKTDSLLTDEEINCLYEKFLNFKYKVFN